MTVLAFLCWIGDNATMQNNHNFIKIFAILVLSTSLLSCVSTGLGVINGLAKLGDYRLYKDVEYRTDHNQKLDIYLPKGQAAKATVVFFYGGCWGQCSNKGKHSYLFVAQTLTQLGYAVVIPDYRQYPAVHFDAIIDDAQAAVVWTVDHASTYQLSDNVFVMGHSSGAHIAAMLVDDETILGWYLNQIKGFIGLAGPYDFYPFTGAYMYELFAPENDYYASQPIHFINGNEPPQLILHGKKDSSVDPQNAVHVAARLKQQQVDHQMIMYEKMSHAKILVSFAKPFRAKSKVVAAVRSFIDSTLADQ